MPFLCRECDQPSSECTCRLMTKIKTNVPTEPMAPVEIAGPVDRAWRQIRDEANKNPAMRAAIVEYRTVLERRATMIHEVAHTMTLGGLHPATRECAGDYF